MATDGVDLGLRGADPNMVAASILAAIDRGITTDEIRACPEKILLSGETKEIVICTGGQGLKISRDIIEELARRGDPTSLTLLSKNSSEKLAWNDPREYFWFERSFGGPERANRFLVALVKEGTFENLGGWNLAVVQVPMESWAYEIRPSDDYWASDEIHGINVKFLTGK